MKDRLGVGFVGAGFMSTFHAKAWQGVRHADIKGVVDKRKRRANAYANLCRETRVGDPKVFNTVTEMVLDPAIDVIYIVTPNYTRVTVMEEIVRAVNEKKAKLIGVACEKPLARTVKEAKRMVELLKETDLLGAYLENQCFIPSITRGRDIIWKRGAPIAGRPYLARCAEEHSGPHEPWFWIGKEQGGGVLSDMLCHCVESSRLMLTQPGKKKSSLKPVSVSCEIASLKWTRPEYASMLKKRYDGKVDYKKSPAEDFARATIVYESPEKHPLIAEVTTSWCFNGPGLRLNFELIGPEYYMQINSLSSELNVFFSRDVKGKSGEDLVEKQAAEQGLMPVLPNEDITYGYMDENKYMVECFLNGRQPEETFEDGLFVMKMLAACYMAAEKGEKVKFPPKGLDDFVPKVVQGTWSAKDIFK
ncbi:Gfo/Idh/MocA family protein [candidate division KSB1 bacterium]